jgi:hypothetical protein
VPFDLVEYRKKYYQQNRVKLLAKQREYAKANPEKRRATSKKSREKYLALHPDANRVAMLKWKSTLKGCLNRKLAHLKKAKRSRVLEVNIDVQFLLSLWEKQKGRCAISSYPMTYGETSLFAVSVDRIEPAGGYTRDNVQLLCQGINFAKNMYSNQEMIDFWNYRTGVSHEQAKSESTDSGRSTVA